MVRRKETFTTLLLAGNVVSVGVTVSWFAWQSTADFQQMEHVQAARVDAMDASHNCHDNNDHNLDIHPLTDHA
jgi:regulatory protein YycH of two-component signal transduction system YycFG